MKLRNVSTLQVTFHDEHSGVSGTVPPGGETPELSELGARDLLELKHHWAPVEPVRTSGKKGKA